MPVSPIAIVENLKRKLQDTYPERLKGVWLYGSCARQDHTVESDIDVLVVIAGPVDWELERNIYDLTYEIMLQENAVIDVQVINEEEYAQPLNRATPWLKNILREGLSL